MKKMAGSLSGASRRFAMCVCWITLALLPCCASAGQGYERAGVSIEAKTIKLSRAVNQIEASGEVRLSAANPSEKIKMTAEARRISLTLFATPNKAFTQRGLDSIKQVEFEGPVKMMYAAPKIVTDETGGKAAEVIVTTTATADRATYDGTQGIVNLSGNVRIVQDDPSIFAEPAVMTGDKAIVNLRRGQETGDYDFKIEGSQKPSRIEIVPKQQTKQ